MRGKDFRPSPFKDAKMLRLQIVSGPVSRMVTTVMPLLLLSLGALPQGLAAQEFVGPLEPADTSSPRATLKSFRENFERAFRDYYEMTEFRVRDRA
ncbi:MAG: hypothetical protein BMS9Abin01_0356 [Gammaproteobacteria bacterium]|nr:MAG: hypothetical protein BMS9Abin01_0356 [Gammaproteobacteria bacterium]